MVGSIGIYVYNKEFNIVLKSEQVIVNLIQELKIEHLKSERFFYYGTRYLVYDAIVDNSKKYQKDLTLLRKHISNVNKGISNNYT